MHPAVAITAALGAIFTLAIIAVLVSTKAQTGTVFTSAGTALSSIISAAVSPVTGNATNLGSLTGATYGSNVANPIPITPTG